ncbi:MAG: hypothetical protein AB7L91_11605 [Dehalococcoidia bacterium]
MTSTPSRLEQRLERLLATTPPPTVRPNPSQSKAKVDFVYLTEADQDLLTDSIRR